MYLHSAVDGYSRLAYTEELPDEKAPTALAILHRARVQVLSLWSAACPDEKGGEVECGLVGEGQFVCACGQAAPLLEAVDAPLDGARCL
ncbi:hypothetical protein GCM10010521_64240 [Streptomyces rameus]|uniref:Uncharacterized protein n=1 Tax=Streptomyces rameus TaxID=68261 RepID=A0ABN3V399_9ACTN